MDDILSGQGFFREGRSFTHCRNKFSTNTTLFFSIFLRYTSFFILAPVKHAHSKAGQEVKGEKEIFGVLNTRHGIGFAPIII